MNNFPFYQHYVIKIVFYDDISVDEKLVDKVATILIDKFSLKVVNQGRHEFTNNGLTKFWVLSQSHLVIHSWPENYALHIDLMTCSCNLIKEKEIEEILRTLGPKEVEVRKLEY